MKKKSLGINALLNGLRSTLNVVFPLITFPYISRVLSVNSVGIYNFSNTYISYFVLLAGLGINTYAIREGSKYRYDKTKINTFASQVFTINIISTICSYLFLILTLLIFKNLQNYLSCILIFSLQIFFTTIGTEWIYTIYEDFEYITIRSIIFNIISIIFLFIFVRSTNDYLWYAGITVFASVGSNILNYIHAKSFIQIKFTKNVNWKYHLKPILVIFASSVAMTLYISSDTTILGLIKNNYDVGIYSIAVKIYNTANGIINGVLIVAMPRLAMLLGRRKIREYKQILSQVINTASVIILPATIGLIMLSKEVVLIIAGEKYLNSILSLQIISLAIIFSNLTLIFNECVLIPLKRENLVLRNTFITGITNVILNLILIPFLSYNGTALTTVIAEFMMMLLDAWAGKDIVRSIIFSKQALINIFSSVVGCIGIIVICLLCNFVFHSLILKTVFSIFFSVIIYVIILVILKNRIIISVLRRTRITLKNKF